MADTKMKQVNSENPNSSSSSISSIEVDEFYISTAEMELIPENESSNDNEKTAIQNQQTNSSNQEQLTYTKNSQINEAIQEKDNNGITFKKYLYNSDNDVGPFRIIIERKEKPINKITIGYLLKKLKLNNGLMDMKKNGKKRVIAYFKTAIDANAVLNYNTKELEYNFFLPENFISVKGVIAGIPDDITIEEIIRDTTSL